MFWLVIFLSYLCTHIWGLRRKHVPERRQTVPVCLQPGCGRTRRPSPIKSLSPRTPPPYDRHIMQPSSPYIYLFTHIDINSLVTSHESHETLKRWYQMMLLVNSTDKWNRMSFTNKELMRHFSLTFYNCTVLSTTWPSLTKRKPQACVSYFTILRETLPWTLDHDLCPHINGTENSTELYC